MRRFVARALANWSQRGILKDAAGRKQLSGGVGQHTSEYIYSIWKNAYKDLKIWGIDGYIARISRQQVPCRSTLNTTVGMALLRTLGRSSAAGGPLKALYIPRSYSYMAFPRRIYRYRPYNDWNPSTVLWSLIGANAAVFLLWRADPVFAARNFVVTRNSAMYRPWTVVTASFSHQDTGHFASNMITLYFFGSSLGDVIGGKKLFLLYIAGGVAASLAHVGWSVYKARNERRSPYTWSRYTSPYDRGALGASGSVQSIGLTNILLWPTRTVLLYGIIPLPAALLGALWVLNDLGGLIDHRGGSFSSIAHAGHLGGALAGLAFYAAFRRGLV